MQYICHYQVQYSIKYIYKAVFNIFFTRAFIKFYVELMAVIYCEVNLMHSVQSILYGVQYTYSVQYSVQSCLQYNTQWRLIRNHSEGMRRHFLVHWDVQHFDGMYSTVCTCTVQCTVQCTSYSQLHGIYFEIFGTRNYRVCTFLQNVLHSAELTTNFTLCAHLCKTNNQTQHSECTHCRELHCTVHSSVRCSAV